jgi:hypothetical protein
MICVGVLRGKERELEEVEAVTEASHTLGGSNSLSEAVTEGGKTSREDSSAVEATS